MVREHQGGALGRLLQDRRDAAGYSRTRLGKLLEISPGTIEGWELGRVGKPPIHDVLRIARFLKIPIEEIERAVFADAAELPEPDATEAPPPRKSGRRSQGAVPLLEAAFRLFGWADDQAAAHALQTDPEQVRRWRRGLDRIEIADYVTLASLVNIAVVDQLKHGSPRSPALAEAAQALGIRAGT
jgi:transcriptional regulator with XRE-family HTH domain